MVLLGFPAKAPDMRVSSDQCRIDHGCWKYVVDNLWQERQMLCDVLALRDKYVIVQ